MRSLKSRRPSPALVISALALFVALSGVAVAASIGTNDIDNKAVTKKKLAKNAAAGNKIKNKTINAKKLKAGAVTANKISDGAVSDSKLDSAEKTRWAVVTSSGALARGKGVTAASTVTPPATGAYNVTFDRDITTCSWVATIGAGDTSSAGGFGSIRTRLETGTTNTVRVRTATTGGGNSPRAFHLSLSC